MTTETDEDTWIWDQGHYEPTGEDLLPYARAVVERAAPVAGERVLDIGTGTGNAALLCADRGARTTGVDLARRLLGVARERALRAQLDVDWVYGDAQHLPFLDDDFDVVVSVSALVLVPDPVPSAAELVRVLRPGGRAVIGGWDWEDTPLFPEELAEVFAEAMADPGLVDVRDADPGWFGEQKVRRLFAGHPVRVEVERAAYGIGAQDSVEHLVDRFTHEHPMVAGAEQRLGSERWAQFVAAFRAYAEASAMRTGDGFALQQQALVVVVTKDD